MIQIVDESKCCGCTACACVCPTSAIKMEPDKLGFFYPKVDETKCIGCGLCNKICQFNSNYDKSYNIIEPKAFAVRHKDTEIVMKSRSGAAFVAISDCVLESKGVVYGAGFMGHFSVCHKRATTKEQRNDLCGSKYVQSNLNDVFRQVREDLNEGRIVLFSGTPCQTAALRSFVGKKESVNLILIDIVCHGVPSPSIWKDYIKYLEKKNKTTFKVANFRDKAKFGWSDHRESFVSENGETIVGGDFTRLFYKHIIFRESCGSCFFTNLKRPSDITLADFWGWEKSVPEMNSDDKGVSLVIINTKKGLELFNRARNYITTQDVDIMNCIQTSLQTPVALNPRRGEFKKEYVSHGFDFIMHKYISPSFFTKVINKLKYGRTSI